MMKRIVFCVLLVGLLGCQKDNTVWLGDLSSFKVSIVGGNPGSESSRLPFSSAGVPFTLSIQAIDGHGAPTDWSGTVQLEARPGELTPSTATITGGTANVDVTLAKGFAKTFIWVTDEGTAEQPGTYATGLSDTIWFINPSIRNIQETDDPTTGAFTGLRVTVETGDLVVTNVTHEGFMVRDDSDTSWNSVYLYNYGRPDLTIGDKLERFSGIASEFLGYTELNFPSWVKTGSGPAPAPTVLDCTAHVDAGGLAMEQWEASLVEVDDAVVEVCSSFPSCPDYDQYQQWTITLPCGARMNVVSLFGVPDFDPTQNQGQAISVARGTVRHVQFANPQWILEPRSPDDLCCPTCTPALTGGC